jgi:hypothetical protein
MRRMCGVPAAGWVAAGVLLLVASAAFEPAWRPVAARRVLALLTLDQERARSAGSNAKSGAAPGPSSLPAGDRSQSTWEHPGVRSAVMVRVTELLVNDDGEGPWRWLGFADGRIESRIQIERDGIGYPGLDLQPMSSEDLPTFREGIVAALRKGWPTEALAQRVQDGELVRRTFDSVAISYDAWHAAWLVGMVCVAVGVGRSLVARRDESRAERRRRGLCAECGYSIGSTAADRCPECGAAVFGWR